MQGDQIFDDNVLFSILISFQSLIVAYSNHQWLHLHWYLRQLLSLPQFHKDLPAYRRRHRTPFIISQREICKTSVLDLSIMPPYNGNRKIQSSLPDSPLKIHCWKICWLLPKLSYEDGRKTSYILHGRFNFGLPFWFRSKKTVLSNILKLINGGTEK